MREFIVRFVVRNLLSELDYIGELEWLFKIINEETQKKYDTEVNNIDLILAQCLDASMVSDIKEIVNDG